MHTSGCVGLYRVLCLFKHCLLLVLWAARLHFDTGHALAMHWLCTGYALAMHWLCTGYALAMHMALLGNVDMDCLIRLSQNGKTHLGLNHPRYPPIPCF